jgi:hypothetical protein
MERAVGRIQGIQAVRVVAEDDRIAEVHVLANRARAPKQLVRDVQSVVLTNFGLDIDYRIVSIVLLEEEQTVAPEREAAAPAESDGLGVDTAVRGIRPALARIASETSGFEADVRVLVRLDGAEQEGAARGSATAGLKLVAMAVIDAVRPQLGATAVDVEFADVVPAGSRQVAVAVLRLLTGRGDNVVVGSALVRRDPNDAMAKATLDAVNRFYGAD